MLIKDPKRTYGIVEPGFFTNPLLVDIAKVTKDVLKRQDLDTVELSKPTLKELVKASPSVRGSREKFQPYRRVIRRLFKIGLRDKKVLFQQALEFAKESKYRDALIKSEQDVNAHKYDGVHRKIEEAKLFGLDPDLGIDYWKDIKDKDRWLSTRRGKVPTGFKKLDRAMGGGPCAGELVIILAGGKVGKTTTLANFAAGAMWKGKNVAIASGELSEEKYRLRIDSLLTETPSSKILKSKEIRKSVRSKLIHARRMIRGGLRIKQYPSGSGTTADIDSWLEQLEEQEDYETDILLVDYLFLFNPTLKDKDRRNRIGQTAVELRGIGVKRDIPVVTPSQGNRASLSAPVLRPKDFAEDISQFWTLDFMLALCQTDLEAKPDPQRARILLASARDVASGEVIKALINRHTYKIIESDWKDDKGKGKRDDDDDVEPEDDDDDE